jgi:hypothetical protein
MISYNDMESCGHFAAYEEPELLADDFCAFVAKVQKMISEKTIPGKEL